MPFRSLRTATDENGRFEFSGVPPGQYLVGVDLTLRRDADVVFPTTYHPGTAYADAATVIHLRRGEDHELAPMVLPPERVQRQLTGSVVFEDGRPAALATVSLREGHLRGRSVSRSVRTAANGTFSLTVHEGFAYVAEASLSDGQQRLAGTAGPFFVTEEQTPLRIVLAPGP